MGRESGRKEQLGNWEVFQELFERDMEVYLPVVDVGIDAIVKNKKGKLKLLQVKTRDPKSKSDKGQYCDVSPEPKARRDFYVVYHLLKTDEFFVVPSKLYFANSMWIKKTKKWRMIFNPKRKIELAKYSGVLGFKQLEK